MVSWVGAGGLTAYDAATGSLALDKLSLSIPGTTDLGTQGITRIGVPLKVAPAVPYQIDGSADISFTGADFDAAASFRLTDDRGTPIASGRLTLIMCWAPASAFSAGVKPTPAQIYASGRATGRIMQAAQTVDSRPSVSTTHSFTIRGPRDMDLEHNTKYWVVLFPGICAKTLGLDLRLSSNHSYPVPGTDINSLGRAVSFNTSRSPVTPKILTPTAPIVANPGDEITINLDLVSGNPDSVGGSAGDPEWRSGIGGIQVQQMRVPPPGSSTIPIWTDLPVAPLSGGGAGRGYYFDAQPPAGAAGGSGIQQVWENGTLVVKCGTSTPAPGKAVIPAGTTLIRFRTFSYGHPYPSTHDAVSGYGHSLVGRPGVHTGHPYITAYGLASGWSQAVSISTSVQVPPPIPLEPRGESAVSVALPTTFRWRYRNTHVNSYPQSARHLQYRKVGTSSWIDIVSGSGSAHEVTTTLPLTPNTQYEWKVKVVDSSATASDWSEPARFWAVPAPASGGVHTLPINTLDSATLGSGKHRVFIYRRGGTQRVGEITHIASLEWNRLRDDISDATVTTMDWTLDGGSLLATLQTWAYEIVIFRDNGFSVDRVWEGPIVRLTYKTDSVQIYARDMMAYAYRRIIRQKMNDGGGSNAGTTVVNRALRVLQNAFAPDDPNVLAYVHPIEDGDPARQIRSAPEYSRTAFEEIDDMASNAGLDYTVVGRSILLWGTRHPLGRLPEFRDKDFGAAPIVSEYGMSLANRYVVSDGNGLYGVGEIGPLKETGVDPVYGLVEMLSSTWASDETEETDVYGPITEEKKQKIIASLTEHAEQSIASRYPAPLVVRVPDNTSINPNAAVSIQHLVPGVAIPLRSTATLRTVSALQKLDSVRVTEEDGVETISVTMSPFRRSDDAMEEEVEVE